MFDKNPMAVWEWHWDFYKLMIGKESNPGHKAIAKFQEWCHQAEGVESILITQNIDDLHCREIRESKILSKVKDPYRVVTDDTRQSFSPFVYEIHGNTHYMHCSDESEEHSKKFYRCPSLE